MCHRLQKVNNDLQDKEGGLVATLNSIKIEGHEREATEEEGVEAENAGEGERPLKVMIMLIPDYRS